MPQLDIYTFLPQFFYFVILFAISFLLVFTRILTSLTATSVTRHIKRGSDILRILGIEFKLNHGTLALSTLFAIAVMALLIYAPLEVVLEFYRVYHFITYTLQEWVFSSIKLVWSFLPNLSSFTTLRCLAWWGRRELQQIIILDDPQIIFGAFCIVVLLLAQVVVNLHPTFLQGHQMEVGESQRSPFILSNTHLAQTSFILADLCGLTTKSFKSIYQNAYST